MKKLLAIALGLILSLGAIIPVQNVYAATCDWTDGYYDFLLSTLPDVKAGRNNFSQYTLYDIDGDGVPELILKNTALEGSYRIYHYKDSQVVYERNLSASTFYKTNKGEFVVAYGDTAGTTYIYYDSDRTIATSVQMFKSRRDKMNSAGEWDWVYYCKGKFVSKEEYDEKMKNELFNIGLVYSDINEINLNNDVILGLSFPSNSNKAYYQGVKNGAGTNVSINFSNGSVESKKDGLDQITGLLLINGVFATDLFPVYIDGVSYVPVKAVAEAFGATVDWVGVLQKVIIKKGTTAIEMYVDENYAIVNGSRKELENAPVLVDGVTYVPVRFVSENLNGVVTFAEGKGDFLSITSISEKMPADYIVLDEFEAASKAKYVIGNIDWTIGRTPFTQGYIEKNIAINVQELMLDRYWVVSVDINDSQKMLVDKYTGHVYSMYNAGGEFGIQPGIEGIIDGMLYEYSK